MDDSGNSSQPKYVPLWQSLKRWPKIVAYSLALSPAILLYGYDFVIVGTISAMPAFQHIYGEELDGHLIIPATWLALWNAASPFGWMVGAILGGYFQDRAGRRRALALGSFFSAVAVAICFVSDLPDAIESRRGVFFTGKLFQGVCIAMLLCVVQTYKSEVLPVLLRGPIIALLPVFTLLGQLIGAVVVYTSLKYTGSESYRICFGSQWPFSAVPFVLAAVLSESPTWLVRKGRMEKALKAQKGLPLAGKHPPYGLASVGFSIYYLLGLRVVRGSRCEGESEIHLQHCGMLSSLIMFSPRYFPASIPALPIG